jgi:hypothetical protein
MITYNTLEDGSLSGNGWGSIPVTHRCYAEALALVESGDAEIIPYSVPVPALADSQDTRRDELRADCTAAIVGLFSSSALGSAHTYDCRIEDQANIRMRQAASTIDAATRNIGVEFTREPHTTAQLDQVVIDMEAHIETQQAKLAGLIATVNAVDTGDDEADAATIAAIVW